LIQILLKPRKHLADFGSFPVPAGRKKRKREGVVKQKAIDDE